MESAGRLMLCSVNLKKFKFKLINTWKQESL